MHPTIAVTVHLRRKPLYYIVNLIIPCFLFSLVAVSTFLLPPVSSDRLGISAFAFLVIHKTVVDM